MSKGVMVGLTNLHYAKLLTDVAPEGTTAGTCTYDTPIRIPGAITANFSPNAANDTLFADDGPYDTASTLGAMTLELNVADLPPAVRADLLGADYDTATGVLKHSSEDIPPYVAVGMSVKKSNGADRYIWYLKGKFTAPDDNNQTKADSINWNTPTITGNFLKRDADNLWRAAIDTDDPAVTATMKNAWFTNVNAFMGGGKVASIAVTTAPTKTAYAVGDAFDPTGMEVTATMDDDTTFVVPNANLVYAPKVLTTGTTAVTIIFGGKLTTQAVTVS